MRRFRVQERLLAWLAPRDACPVAWGSRLTWWPEFLGGGKQRFDRFVAEYYQRGDRLQSLRDRLVTACLVDPADYLFAKEFFQVIGGVPRAVLGSVRMVEPSDLIGEL